MGVGMNKKGSSLLETRRQNRMFIKDTIFRMDTITRTDLSRELGLTLPTITTSVNEMLGEGILEEVPLPESSRTNAMGRKPVAIRFRADAASAVGVELGPYATRAVLLNMKGEVLDSAEDKPGDEDYRTMLRRLADLIEELLRRAKPQNLLGVGVGLPGFIESTKGIIRSNPRKDWTGRHFAGDLEELLGMPVRIDNNVRLRAIGYEMGFHGRRPDTFAYFYISKGIACPLMVKDDILSGYTAGAGEIGHTIIYVEQDGIPVQRCVDDLVGEKTILDRCREKMELGGAKRLKAIVEEAGEFEIKQVLQAQQQGDGDVCGILEEIMEYLGIALANVVNFINPGFVVVDGYIMKNDMNRSLLKRSAVNKFYGLNEEEVKLVFKPFLHDNGARGAAYFIIRCLFLEK